MDLDDCGFGGDDEEAPLEEQKKSVRQRIVNFRTLGAFAVTLLVLGGVLYFFASGAGPSFGQPKMDISGKAATKGTLHAYESDEHLDEDKEEDYGKKLRQHAEQVDYDAKLIKSKSTYGEIRQVGGLTYFVLTPIVILNQSDLGEKRVVISLAFETTRAGAIQMQHNGLKIRDALIGLVQSIDGLTLQQKSAALMISTDLQRFVERTSPTVVINASTVQEFIVF